jgi:hypothetical protein
MNQNPSPKAEAAFCVHLIAISGPRPRPKVRILFVAIVGADAVYEGLGTWAKCVRWLKQLHCPDRTKHDLDAAKTDFGRNRCAVLREVAASPRALEALGLHRADREAVGEAQAASASALAPLFGR